MTEAPQFELKKFAHRKEAYVKSVEAMLKLGFDTQDYLHHFPAFAGHLTLARFLSFYEAYKMTLDVAGHIAEVGVFKGAVSIFYGKLLKLFEPEALTMVHGFDWFKGANVTTEEKFVRDGECTEDYERVTRLISLQQLDSHIVIHNLDVTTQLAPFMKKHEHLQFKLVFVDCGVHDVVAASIDNLWPRLTPGGIMMFDHFNHEVAPGETRAIRERLPNAKMRAFHPFGWMPTGYVVKE